MMLPNENLHLQCRIYFRRFVAPLSSSTPLVYTEHHVYYILHMQGMHLQRTAYDEAVMSVILCRIQTMFDI